MKNNVGKSFNGFVLVNKLFILPKTLHIKKWVFSQNKSQSNASWVLKNTILEQCLYMVYPDTVSLKNSEWKVVESFLKTISRRFFFF